MEYNEDDYLMLSGIQHFYFCVRQWCLIHIEQQWAENSRTMEGQLLHKKVDNPFIKETRDNIFYSRAMPVSSKKLGLSGILDLVEFKKSPKGIVVDGREGRWLPSIVEYKRGKKKSDNRDIVQLVAEVICLEEKLGCRISESYIYYAKTKDRLKVKITDSLREEVENLSIKMHQLFSKNITVNAESYKNCTKCSLYDLCVPKITKKRVNVENYIDSMID